MAPAGIVSLRTRALNVAHLCFEVSGILDGLSANLGDEIVSATPSAGQFAMFAFDAFYQTLSAMPTVPAHPPFTKADPSLLLYGVQKIQADTGNSRLAWLRAEGVKAVLNKAMNNRQNTYFAKYANKDLPASTTASGAPTGGIIATMRQYYDPNVYHSKPDLLGKLAQNSQDQWDQVFHQYSSDPRGTGPLKTGVNTLCSDTASYGYSAASSVNNGATVAAPVAASNYFFGNSVKPPQPPAPWPAPPSGSIISAPQTPSPLSPASEAGWLTAAETQLAVEEGFTGQVDGGFQQTTSSQIVSSQDAAHQKQTITPSDYGYRIPMIEAGAQYHRAQISLIDQRFAQFMFGQNLPNLETVFTNELNSIDLDVYRLQIAYLNTILMSPIAGTVTGVYKRTGDAVRAGEPVIRVEDSTNLLLEGTLVYRGRISTGSTFQLKTDLFDLGSSSTVTGKVISARGHRNDDQWDVIIQYVNDGTSGPILPFGYHFDYDDTFTIT